ncbi:aminoglycoside phosphotransferase family protein [Stenotrophomonas maltophilia]|uniref:phosphotransferase enzyme family protein n=1 Tax=Stenotrophomonas maltophilia TaxID=40324 RepID=UPI0015DF6134|nr:phosphotransferase [Stenotrophomonas maltophilia]MBA0280224.1 aminoglycoside phosphotransferase family protein [Stenotrophomonas maltophilia]MBA0344569.1 aminoglycoside phosphotransferase family protein [Stenotrophomonas maltophilia]MBA0356377.1 aminoglycoside phosphotransferase family protein [Stenotrophomonas maltophilia]MBA0518634.1 aminoglycoside phosphotransferase family protein [Stenotrophomonas maltophilia]
MKEPENCFSHLVQGLNNDEVAADWPPISAADIAWLSARYPQLGEHSQPRWHSPRPLSAAAIVDSVDGAVFVKRHHHSVRSAVCLEEEHRFISHLAAAGVPVVQVLAAADGRTAVEHGEWTFELHAVGVGEDVYRDAVSWSLLTDVAQAREAGRALAQLHRAAASYHAPQRSTHVLVARDDLIRADDPIAAIKAELHERPGLARYLARLPWEAQLQREVLPWHAGLAERLRDEPRLWAHNDWHVSNLLWRDGQVSTVLDFGLASPTSALFDLATAIERNAVAWLELERGVDAVRIDIALALLEGYRQVLPLSAARVHLLADLLPMVHFDFALSEVEYFEGITGSTANADVAWQPFMLGHPAWFRTAPGQTLLQALHAAA